MQIGIGFATYIMTAATCLLVALAALTGSPALALATGTVFGLVRGLAVLLSARCRTGPALRQLHLRLSALEPASLRTVMIIEALLAGGLAYAAAGPLPGIGAVLLAGLILLAGEPRLAARGRLSGRARPARG